MQYSKNIYNYGKVNVYMPLIVEVTCAYEENKLQKVTHRCTFVTRLGLYKV
jgi:hypothetical protein